MGILYGVLAGKLYNFRIRSIGCPAFLTIQFTIVEEWFLEVAVVIPTANHESDQRRHGAACVAVGIRHPRPGAVVVVVQARSINVNRKCRAVDSMTAGRCDTHMAGHIKETDRVVVLCTIIQGRKRGAIVSGNDNGAGQDRLRFIGLGRNLEDQVVEIEKGINFVVAVCSEREAFVSVESAVERYSGYVLGFTAYSQVDAGLGLEVHRIGNMHPLVHRPGLSNHNLVLIILQAAEAESAVSIVLDLESHGFVPLRTGQIDSVARRSAIPVDIHRDFHPGIPGAVVDIIFCGPVNAFGDHGVHHRAIRERQTVSDIGAVHIAAVAAVSDDPAILPLQIADLHIRRLEIFLVEDRSGADENEDIGATGSASIYVQRGTVVVTSHLVPKDIEANLSFPFAGAALRCQRHPGRMVWQAGGPGKCIVAGILNS